MNMKERDDGEIRKDGTTLSCQDRIHHCHAGGGVECYWSSVLLPRATPSSPEASHGDTDASLRLKRGENVTVHPNPAGVVLLQRGQGFFIQSYLTRLFPSEPAGFHRVAL